MALNLKAMLANPGIRAQLFESMDPEDREDLLRTEHTPDSQEFLADMADAMFFDFSECVLTLVSNPGNRRDPDEVWVHRWHGQYFVYSSQADLSGPYASAEKAFEVGTLDVNAVDSVITGCLPFDQMVAMASEVTSDDGDTTLIEGARYGWVGGEFREVEGEV